MTKKIFSVVIILAAAIALTLTVSAQNKKENMNARLFNLVQMAKQGKAKLDPARALRIREDFSKAEGQFATLAPPIFGTWNCKIDESDTGLPPFEALQTFGQDGTFVETSNLLGMGGEGPAHGVYDRSRNGYILTFELFVFDPATGESVGRVRVRASIRMFGQNAFDADTAVDFIEPDGNTITDIDGGPFHGTRMLVKGL